MPTRSPTLRRLRRLRAGMFFAALCLLPSAWADEVRVLAAGAAKMAIERLAPAFERETGHQLRATFDTVGAQRDRVLAAPTGTAADVVVLSAAALADLRRGERLAPGPTVDIGLVAVALAVPASAAAPDISTPQALDEALRTTPSIAYADPARGATAGTHFARVLDQLALRGALQGRLTVLPFGVDVIRAVSEGKFAMGVSQSSEILQHEGIRLVGPLPPPYALTTRYAAAAASDRAAARELLRYFAGPAAQQAFRATGFLPE
ncbi:MAG TPA: substrate-binding domain-containing protein [Ramlibacter sp.]|jgi:molybdate transport system substrate-binding protein|uniref:molybdate ABC transporter substrate-binding protein n=1 Tax=Ramlibacter sp. TaxID=1917967 RepID=UPI002D3B9F3B|nr:substrate-binding domain-containing protein [Ramlibacter sp.]HZY20147.1 substrate-binding domain-containing protein [Ramlibacter sp.]